MTSLIPPPRLVMRSSASLLRSSSVFSANDVVGCSIAGAGVEKGEAAGAAVAVTTAGDGCGGWRLHLASHPPLPSKQSDYAKNDNNPRSSVHNSATRELFVVAARSVCPALLLRAGYSAQRGCDGIAPGNRIISAATPRLAARQPFQSQPASAENAVSLHSLEQIRRTGRCESAAAARPAKQREGRRERPLVNANQKANQSTHPCRIEARLARRNHSSLSAA